MALTELYTGTETVSTTEWSLTTDTAGPDADTTAGEFQVWLDLNALANGDVFTLAGYEKVRSGDTQRKFLDFSFAHAQSAPVWVSPFFHLRHGWDFTLLKNSGTDRAINWSIRRKDDAALDAAGVRSAVGLASANLDTQLSAIDDLVDTEVAAIKTVVDAIEVDTQDIQGRLPAALTADGNIKADIKAVNAITVDGAGTAGDPWGPA